MAPPPYAQMQAKRVWPHPSREVGVECLRRPQPESCGGRGGRGRSLRPGSPGSDGCALGENRDVHAWLGIYMNFRGSGEGLGPLVGAGPRHGCGVPRGMWPTCRARASPQPGLPRATSNARVRETVALELSYVNSSLQLLKEELEELNCSVDTDTPDRCVCRRRTCGCVCRRCVCGYARVSQSCVLCSRRSRGWTPCRWGQQGPALEPELKCFWF